MRPANRLSRRTSAVAATIASKRKCGSVGGERPREVVAGHVTGQLPGPPAVGIRPAQPDRGQPVALVESVAQPERVERGDRVAGADGAGVDIADR